MQDSLPRYTLSLTLILLALTKLFSPLLQSFYTTTLNQIPQLQGLAIIPFNMLLYTELTLGLLLLIGLFTKQTAAITIIYTIITLPLHYITPEPTNILILITTIPILTLATLTFIQDHHSFTVDEWVEF